MIISNIMTLIKTTDGIRVQDVERKCGVAQGYFSRVSNRGTERSIPIGIIATVSDIFNVSIDDLVNKNLFYEQRMKELQEEMDRLRKERDGRVNHS